MSACTVGMRVRAASEQEDSTVSENEKVVGAVNATSEVGLTIRGLPLRSARGTQRSVNAYNRGPLSSLR